MFLEELIQDSQNSFLNLWIMGRAYAFSFLYDKLKRITASNLTLFFERDSIVNTLARLKDITTLRRNHNIIDILFVYAVKREMYHNDTIVPLIPLRSHSSFMRFCAACLISSECLNRASASSYVIFFVSINHPVLIYSVANLGIISEKKKKADKNICKCEKNFCFNFEPEATNTYMSACRHLFFNGSLRSKLKQKLLGKLKKNPFGPDKTVFSVSPKTIRGGTD